MVSAARALGMLVVGGWLLGCTAAPGKATEPAAGSGEPAGTAEPEVAAPPDRDDDPDAAATGSARPAPGPRPAPVTDYEISFEDCRVLADVYAKAWLSDAMAKDADRKSNDKTRKLAEQSNRQAAEQASENWVKACNQVAGSAFLRERLVCASKARTVKRFEDCWAGKAE